MTNDPSSRERTETLERIENIKAELGKDLVIFGHFYQSDEIVRFADFVGDSLQLAQEASRRKDKRFVIVCAVTFMAEMARILCDPSQEVLHPSPEARCPLAEMAPIGEVERVWDDLMGKGIRALPVVYVNSTAELKAFCGKNGGAVCTSSNAHKVFQWVLEKNRSVFFFPDENLGRNTAHRLGIGEAETVLCDPVRGIERQDMDALRGAKVFLWKGHCYVHTEFLKEQIDAVRGRFEGIKIAVHPECVPEVCAKADVVGATSVIKKMVEESPAGSKWAIGTEWNLVNRLKASQPDKVILPLKNSRCSEMAQVTPERLLVILEGLARGDLPGRLTVDEAVAANARTALATMLAIG